MCKSGHKICFLPAGVQCWRIYMIWKRAHKPAIILQIENAAREPREWNYFSYGEDIFLLPSHSKAKDFLNGMSAQILWNRRRGGSFRTWIVSCGMGV